VPNVTPRPKAVVYRWNKNPFSGSAAAGASDISDGDTVANAAMAFVELGKTFFG
jgi:hypothetical protein